MIAKRTDGLLTYVGFDSDDNGKRWIEEKGNYTYVIKQDNEWEQAHVPICAYTNDYLKEAKEKRYDTPPYSIEKRIVDGEIAYHFWLGKDNWFFDKNEAIEFIYKVWDEKER